MTAPWERTNALFPPPLFQVLEKHYSTSISKAMKGGADDEELEDDDDDLEELSELEVLDESDKQVRIWLDGQVNSSSSKEIKPLDPEPLDFKVTDALENKVAGMGDGFVRPGYGTLPEQE